MNNQSFSPRLPWWCSEYCRMAILLVLTFLLYLPALNNGFTNWDDGWYVTNNVRIRELSWDGIFYWFTHYFHGQYSPVGNLVMMLVYAIDGLNPFWFHLTSGLLHLANVVLVYVFLKRLTKDDMLSFFVTVFFAIHPMQTEAIAWLAAIKIPLYALFTLIAIIWYIRYVDTGRWRWFLLAFIPFLFSFGSKEQSMVIVGSLIFIDYYRGRNVFSVRVLLEKLPWLLLGVGMGLNSIAATASYGIVTPAKSFGFIEQLVLPSVAFVTYLWKLVVPVGMTAIYPYPDVVKPVPLYWYLCFAIVIAVIVFFIFKWKKNRNVNFGIGFFVANIIMVLQIMPTRNIIVADRYVYLPIIGYFFILGVYFLKGLQSGSGVRVLLLSVFAIWLFFLSAHTINRNRVWNTTETMWRDVVEKQPDALIGWYNLGGYYADSGNHEQAVKAYQEVVRINPSYHNGYYNMANSYYHMKDYSNAIKNYQRALKIKPRSKSAALNLYMTYLSSGRNDMARQVLEALDAIHPNDPEVEEKRKLLPE